MLRPRRSWIVAHQYRQNSFHLLVLHRGKYHVIQSTAYLAHNTEQAAVDDSNPIGKDLRSYNIPSIGIAKESSDMPPYSSLVVLSAEALNASVFSASIVPTQRLMGMPCA